MKFLKKYWLVVGIVVAASIYLYKVKKQNSGETTLDEISNSIPDDILYGQTHIANV